ncbi:Ubiquinol-cytochrome C reductase iron-sulfur subunit [hydrothermal vent metagenome]|uniref:Ubiquinol-cytochrome c reductase iron-sulfur subunit n=1 Tax=hydrothermal vent metagenome TaxID=652676 RepID=A0A3B0TXZ3_9ZZZZ
MASDATTDTTKRDFLYVATGAMGAVGTAVAVWPLIDQMNPDASTLALSTIEVNLSPIAEGESITVMWRGQPIFIRYRTADDIAQSKAVPLEELKDPASDAERVTEGQEQWLVQIGICTHLGCVPTGQKSGSAKGDFGGWFCPCHGSHYDTAGRIRKGPAPLNLVLPDYNFLSDTLIKIG